LRQALDIDLLGVLVANGVPEAVQIHLATSGCCTAKQFANWVDRKEDLQSAVLDDVPSFRSNRAALAALKQSWREVDAIVARGVKRSAEGLTEEAIDDPLPDTTQRSVETAFTNLYRWELEPRDTPCDSLLGRCKRESDRWCPTMFSASMVRSLAYSRRTAGAKKHRVTDRITMEVDVAALDDSPAARIMACLQQYHILGVAWAMGGCFEVIVDSVSCRYCHWQDSQRYVDDLRNRVLPLLDKHTEDSVTEYLFRTEEAIRGYAIEATRNRERPLRWGAALT